jgi:formate hydrogenlyase transcriptional activator
VERTIRLAALIALGVTLALAAVVAHDTRSLVGRPYPGFPVLAHGVISVPVLAPPRFVDRDPRLRPPYRVVAIDGRPVATGQDVREAVEAAGPGAVLRYHFAGPRRPPFDLSIPVATFTEADFRSFYLPVALSSLLLLAVGTVPIVLRPALPAARLVFIITLSIGSGLGLLVFDYVAGYRFTPWLRATASIAGAAMLELGLLFPTPRWPITRWPRATRALIWLGSLGVFALHAVSFYALPALAFPVDVAQMLLFVLGCGLLATNCIVTALRSDDPLRRQQALVVLPGPALYTVATVRLVLGAWDLDTVRFTMAVPLPATVMAVSLAYAMLKQNVFEFDAVVRRALTLAIVALAGAGASVALFAGLHAWLGGSAWLASAAAVTLLLLAVPTLVPFWQQLEGVVEGALFPDQRRARQLIHQASRELALLRDGEALARFLHDTLAGSLGSKTVHLLAGPADDPLGEIAPDPSGPTLTLPPADPLYVALRRGLTIDATARPARHRRGASRAAVQRLVDLGGGLAVALPAREGQLGALILGPRRDGRLYTSDDAALVEILAGQAATALENARAWEEVRVLEQRMRAENVYLREEMALEQDLAEIVGHSPAIRAVIAQVRQVAPTDVAVLVEGETGTGKELVVRALHGLGPRAERVLVKVACAAIPETLLESELFGHERGAFTGAAARKIGRFEVADGGTLFLDDVDTLPLGVQAKLLRALQEGEVQRLGSNDVRRVDVRIVAATNRDLLAEVRAGRFREDLYYRLNVIPIRIPPLRERIEDVPLLVEQFLRRAGGRLGHTVRGVAAEAMAELQSYTWPGNVRELRNVVERALVLCPGDVLRLPGPLDPDAAGASAAPVLEDDLGKASLAELVRRYKVRLVTRALDVAGGNQREAAALLGLHRPSLTRMVRDLGLREPPSSMTRRRGPQA